MRLINLIKSIRPKNFGVIVRTVAENKSVSELDKDLQSLTSIWKEGVKKIKKAKVGEKIIGEENKATSLLRDILNSSFDNIVIDDKELHKEVKSYVKKFEPKKEKIVKLYSSPAPNRVLSVDKTNVNDLDVWVQKVTGTGVPLEKWNKVPSLFGQNTIYNSIALIDFPATYPKLMAVNNPLPER